MQKTENRVAPLAIELDDLEGKAFNSTTLKIQYANRQQPEQH